ASGPEAAVDADADPRTQPLGHQRLLRLGDADLPREPGVLDGRQRRRTGAAVLSGDHHDLGETLGHAGRDLSDAGRRHQLHADVRARVDLLQVVDELGEVLDRVDVVVRRGRDEGHARLRVTQAGDLRGDFVAGELSALAGLRTLRHLDLQLVGPRAVFGGDAEAPGRDLLDPAVAVAFGSLRPVAVRVLAAFAGVGLAADHVER